MSGAKLYELTKEGRIAELHREVQRCEAELISLEGASEKLHDRATETRDTLSEKTKELKELLGWT